MSTPKRHHYLPRFYLDRFTDRGRLYLFDREEAEHRIQTPKNTAVQTHFYTADMPDGSGPAPRRTGGPNSCAGFRVLQAAEDVRLVACLRVAGAFRVSIAPHKSSTLRCV